MSVNNKPINEEVVHLLEIANTKGETGRGELFGTITNFLERRHGELSQIQLSLMSDILEKLIHNVEIDIRKKMANKLSDKLDAPLDLIILLANDNIDVSLPILTFSRLLSDEELIKIIHHKTVQHQLGIASRKQLSSHVCRELISVGTTKTLIMLLNNYDAHIDPQSLAILAEKSKNNIPIQAPLIERPDLPKVLAAKIYQWVSDGLKESILANFKLNEDEIANLLESTVSEIHSENMSKETQEKSEAVLVNKLYDAGNLKPSFLMKCLYQGQSSLFEIAFSKMTKVPRNIMRAFLYDRGSESLAVSCCAAGIDRSVFLTIYELTRKAQNKDPNLSKNEIEAALEYFNKYDKKRAMMTIQKWVAEATHTTVF
ncbi:MAG: DUF2336 domain-containing protein [Emcibacter sp.]|nr:DUF2336 domain-containing protein [Emcibacter sp.]